VLVVEDSSDIREMWRTWLTHCGFAVSEAHDGAEAVRVALSEPPKLVLMDLWMPGMDGLAATRQLRAHPATARLPIIALTADDQRCSAADSPFDVCRVKPIMPDELLEVIRTVLRRHATGV
jgi:DNA-binding response OmpR family regulator